MRDGYDDMILKKERDDMKDAINTLLLRKRLWICLV